MIITAAYLRSNPEHIFVFGDNTERKGKSGAAALRDEPNIYGVITKKYAHHNPDAFYTPMEYTSIFYQELKKLKREIINNPNKIYLISKIGSGVANKHQIFETVIEPVLKKQLQSYLNVKFLW